MFKHTIAIILIALSWVPVPAFSQTVAISQLDMKIPSGPLTLEKAQHMALVAAPSVKQAVAQIEAAKAVVDQARSALRPSISVKLGQRYQNSTAQPDWSPEIRANDTFNTTTAGIEANWLLFDGFASRARILAAKHQVGASQQTVDETRRLLVDAVSGVFYQAQLAVEGMLIAQQNQIFNRTLEDEANKRWLAGTIPEAEKLNFSVKALQAETDYLTAGQSFQLVTTVLAELLALEGGQLPVEMYPVRSNENILGRIIPVYSVELTYALDHHPGLKVIQASIAALQETKRAHRGSYLPRLTFRTGFDYTKLNDMKTGDQEEHDTYAGLNLSWDLYQGGKRSAQVREAEQNIRKFRHQHQAQVLTIQSAIQQAITNAEVTRSMYERQRQSLILTEKIREHTEKAYRAGVANLTRLNEAQTDLIRVAGAEASSRINYLLALQQVKAASGRILDN